ncbi:MAG TPA: DUF4126 domain-containing protein [Usitatibacteraceae bacterium]|nr:DUF4126 domain-containing protein [Usitatibacteraceae bacterium]
MSPNDWQLLQAVALGSLLAWASGLRLYLVVFVLGLAARLGYLDLPDGLAILSHTYVIAAAGLLLAIEFLADKVPGIDSAWDAVHTFIRIPAGALLAAGAAGDDLTAITVAAGLLGGTITAGTHFAKAGGRVAINASPEPFSNWIASFTEDAMVLGGIWIALNHPIVFMASLAVFMAFAAWFVIAFARFVRRRLERTETVPAPEGTVR